MMNEGFEAITPDVMADLFEDLLAEAVGLDVAGLHPGNGPFAGPSRKSA